MNLILFFEKLTARLQLGSLLSDAVRVYGGYMHTMYRLDTTTDIYIVKLLNQNVMKRSTAFDNYSEADRLESILEKNSIPIVSSLAFYGKKMQEIDGQYFYVYKWYDGKTIKGKDITKMHCHKISKALSCIHNIDTKDDRFRRSPINIDWDYYIKLAKKQNSLLYDVLETNKELLYNSQNNGNMAIQNIPAVTAICHNDMDSKNVLWMGQDFKIIDLECLSYSNPYLELFELGLCWSGYEECNIDFELFTAFMDAYWEEKPKLSIDWEAVYYSNCGRLEWLEYNVKRALLIECGSIDEQELGIQQVKETMNHVIYYDHVKGKLMDCLLEKNNDNTPLIETERLILRKFTEEDVDDILLIYGDDEVNKFLPWFPIKTIKEATEYFHNNLLPCCTKNRDYHYAIALKMDNHAIGYVNINNVGDSNDMGYGLRKEFWHKGITVEACTAICKKFKKDGYPYITATHDINNSNSGCVMKKLGMTYRYSYEELWQPKNVRVTFRMYQYDFNGMEQTYTQYQKEHQHFIEPIQ